MLKMTTNDILDITKESFIKPSIERGSIEVIDKSLYLTLTLDIENRDKEYSKYMEYFVVLSDNDDFLDEFNDNTFNLSDVKQKVFSIKRFLSIETFITLVVPKTDTLKCFIISILNVQDFLFDNKIDYADFQYEYVTNNQIISDIIIENDKLLSQSYIFYDGENNIYLGPVLKEANKFYSEDGSELSFSLVPNNKFVDYRVFNENEKPLFSQQGGFALTPSQKVEEIALKKSYLNNLGVSQTSKNTFNHFFSFDFISCFKDNILLKNIDLNQIAFSLSLYKKSNLENPVLGLYLDLTEYGIEYPANNNYELDYFNNTQTISGEQRFVFDDRMSSYKSGDTFLFCIKNTFNDKKYDNSYFLKLSFKDPSQEEAQRLIGVLGEQIDSLRAVYNSFTQNDQVQDEKVQFAVSNIIDVFVKVKNLSQQDKNYIQNNLYTALSTFYGTTKTFADALDYLEKEKLFFRNILNNTNQKSKEIEFMLRLDDIKSTETQALFYIFEKSTMLFEDVIEHNKKTLEKIQQNNFDYSLIKGKQTYLTSEQVNEPGQLNSYNLVKVDNGKEYFLDKSSFNDIRFVQLLFELLYNDSLSYFCDVTTLDNLKDFIESNIDLNKELVFTSSNNDLYKIITGSSFIQSLKLDKDAQNYKKKIFDYISLCVNIVIGNINNQYKKLDVVDFLSVDSTNSIFKKYDIDENYLQNLPYHYKSLIFNNLFTNVFLTLHYYLLYKNVYFIEYFDVKNKQWLKMDFLNLNPSAYVCRFVRYSDEFIDDYVPELRQIKINLTNKVFIIDKRTEIANAVSQISLQQIKPNNNNNKVTTNNFIDKEKVNKIKNAKKF